MPDTLIEHAFTCPYCGEGITMLLDLSVAEQRYVEDCEVCCNPIDIAFRVRRGAILTFEANRNEG